MTLNSDDPDGVAKAFARLAAMAFTETMSDQDDLYWNAFRSAFAHHLELYEAEISADAELRGWQRNQLVTLIDLAKACLFSEVAEEFRSTRREDVD